MRVPTKSGVVCLVAGLVLAGCGSSGPGAVAKAVEYAAAKGDTDTVMKYVDTQGSPVATAKMETVVMEEKGRVESKGGLDSVKVTKTVMKDDTHAVVDVLVTYKNKSSDPDELPMQKVDGKWLVTFQ